jgi:nucleoside-diphosphate-sugar epimerase
MPFVQAPTKVLVSGANGYVAIWVVQNLSSKGYSVHGTVHSAEKGEAPVFALKPLNWIFTELKG